MALNNDDDDDDGDDDDIPTNRPFGYITNSQWPSLQWLN